MARRTPTTGFAPGYLSSSEVRQAEQARAEETARAERGARNAAMARMRAASAKAAAPAAPSSSRNLGVTGASGESARRSAAAESASLRADSVNEHQGAAAMHSAAAASYRAEGNTARSQHHDYMAEQHHQAVRTIARGVPSSPFSDTRASTAAPAGTTAASSRKLGTARELQATPGSGSLESRRTQAMHQGHHDEHDRRSKAERSSPAARRNLEDAFTTEKRYAQGASDEANRAGTALAHTRAAAAHREAGEAASRAGYSSAQHYARAREHDERAVAVPAAPPSAVEAQMIRSMSSKPTAHSSARLSAFAEHLTSRGAHTYAEHEDAAVAHVHAAQHAQGIGQASVAQHHLARAQHHAEARVAVASDSRAAAHAARENRAMRVTQHGTATTHTPHDQAMHRATQTGAKGGKFVVSKSGKKRYVGTKGR